MGICTVGACLQHFVSERLYELLLWALSLGAMQYMHFWWFNHSIGILSVLNKLTEFIGLHFYKSKYTCSGYRKTENRIFKGYILGPVVELDSLPSLIYPDLSIPRTANWSSKFCMMAELKWIFWKNSATERGFYSSQVNKYWLFWTNCYGAHSSHPRPCLQMPAVVFVTLCL